MGNFELENKIVIAPVKTLDILFSEENGSDAVALYFFYYKTAKKQKTNQIWATQTFCMEGLKWGKKRFLSAKKVLEKYSLVQVIKGRKVDDKWYIKVGYIQSNRSQSEPLQSEAKRSQSELVLKEPTNALNKDININAYKYIPNGIYGDKSPKDGYGNAFVSQILRDFSEVTGLETPADRDSRRVAWNFHQRYGSSNFRPALEFLIGLWKKDITKIETVKLHYPTYQRDVLKVSSKKLTKEQQEWDELLRRNK